MKSYRVVTFSVVITLFAITAPVFGQSDGNIFVENGIRNPIEVWYTIGEDTVRATVPGKTTLRVSPGPIPVGTEVTLTLRRVNGDSAKTELPPPQVIKVTVNNDVLVHIIRFKLDGTLIFEITEVTPGTAVISRSWGSIKTLDISRQKVR